MCTGAAAHVSTAPLISMKGVLTKRGDERVYLFKNILVGFSLTHSAFLIKKLSLDKTLRLQEAQAVCTAEAAPIPK